MQKKKQVKKEGNVSVQSSDENFTALRMQMEDQRSEQKSKITRSDEFNKSFSNRKE